jgi:hypothetical protein
MARVDLSGCMINEWPGPAYHVHNVVGCSFVRTHAYRPKRGGIIFNRANRNVEVVGCEVELSGDDSLAFNADAPTVGGTVDASVSGCTLSVEPGVEGGSPLAIRGGENIAVSGGSLRGGSENNGGLFIQEDPTHSFPPRNITCSGLTIGAPNGPGIHLSALTASLIKLSNITVKNAGKHGVQIFCPTNAGALTRITLENIDIENPGISDATARGIFVSASQASAIRTLRIKGGSVNNAPLQGIFVGANVTATMLEIEGFQVDNANASNTADTDAVYIASANRSRVSMPIHDTRSPKGCRYGINWVAGTGRIFSSYVLAVDHLTGAINAPAGVDTNLPAGTNKTA